VAGYEDPRYKYRRRK